MSAGEDGANIEEYSNSAFLWELVENETRLPVRAAPFRLEFRRTAEGREAVDFTFAGSFDIRLDSSAGFEVEVEAPEGKTVVKMIRTSDAEGASLFCSLSDDLIRLADDCLGLSQGECARALADRISAWQTFMKRSASPLSDAKEIGLFGELAVLKAWLEGGGRPERIRDVWTGPLHGAHDFMFGSGNALEVKTSLADKPFKATIESIMQLDVADCPHLVLAAMKIIEDEDGETLLTLREDIRNLLKQRMFMADFESGLITSGLNPDHPGRDLRSFRIEYARLFRAASLPRIVPGTVPGVVSARYGIVLIDETGRPAPGVEEGMSFEQYIRKQAGNQQG